MNKKEPLPQIFLISRNDSYHKVLKFLFRSHGMTIYRILEPTEEFGLLDAGAADIIIADVEDANFGFENCEVIEMIKESFPLKKVIAITNNYNPEILAKVKQLGAMGYIYRDCVDEELAQCVINVLNGQPCYMAINEQSNTQKIDT